jgi:murein DD-endopeptidase MepM/ murein hydrolase activator NlpD
MNTQVGFSDCIPASAQRQPVVVWRAGNRTGAWRLARNARSTAPLRVLLSIVLTAAPLAGCTVATWPAEGRLTSGYGIRFRGWIPSIHHGVDVSVPEGTPILAMADGHVTHAGPLGSYGQTVIIAHGRGITSLYAHLSRVEVAVGARVERRTLIGRSGQTGNATGPHLHFEIRRHGRTEDPVPLLGGAPRRD